MLVFSIAQILPVHVVEQIARHISYKPPLPIYSNRYPHPPCRPMVLTPMMKLCSTWRHAACSMFYRSVFLCLGKPNFEMFDDKCLSLKNAIECGGQQHIRHIFMLIDMENFNQDWGVQALNLSSILLNCKTMPAVRSVLFYFVVDHMLETNRHVISRVFNRCSKHRIERNIRTFAKSLHRTVPNLTRIKISQRHIYGLPQNLVNIIEQTISRLNIILNTQLTYLALDNITTLDRLLSSLSSGNLCSIILNHNQLSTSEVALIKLNSSKLEQLHIFFAAPNAVLQLTINDSSSYGTHVYPRLKHLCIYTSGIREPSDNQPLVDPFPALVTLNCEGWFPFASTIVLSEGRSHITHLRIDLDRHLLAALNNEKLLEEGAFKKLRYVSLGLTKFSCSYSPRDVDMLLPKVLHLCRSAQTICFRHMHFNNAKKAISQLRVSESLQYLDICFSPLNIDQLIAFLCACPNLLNANVSLKDLPRVSGKGMPTHRVLDNYQQKYSTCTSSVRYLGLASLIFPSTRRAGEFLLLLVDILTSIVRVRISARSLLHTQAVLKDIDSARKRSAYDGHNKLDRVEFLIDMDWQCA
ncbi:hypothetical protein COEREDRAFT_83574 [Coemansia reversa NRRL 1564]|uniref:F-box domain-containing protein n=1 Tax=Coemansia reversa (strain ATCC 12441 / NRRL 1564) TaxID=763665 RepID=A0A2G5B2T5_COERN|nr:hypothetical protein COEREDRAFT_83574 [Coemansia reversa NRRL 1564]|eukprot:PIA13332.1 hypothetical protein COEREDRAFT_83574 [Coemansia reversa NRRL 1564]